MSKFQIIVTVAFVVFIFLGVGAFALFKGSGNSTQAATITVWGTIPQATFLGFITDLNSKRGTPISVNYAEQSEANFNQNFIQALAKGQGPDVILIPQSMILENESKILLIPYTALPERTFKDTYIQEAEIYNRTDGITAIPFSIDPMVMYWNRDTFNSAGIASAGTAAAPITWSKLASYGSTITQKDNNSNIRKSVMALGEFSNVDHAPQIFSTLLFQAGNPVTIRGSNNSVSSALGSNSANPNGLTSTQAALSFFSTFANPSDHNYSWNRSLPNSQSFFLSGNLATYFGFASELPQIRSKNPNLNFDVAPLPQADQGKTRATFGRLYGFSLVRSTSHAPDAYNAIQNFVTPAALTEWSKFTGLPSVRRDMIAQGTSDPYLTIFNNAALTAKGFLDPDPAKTNSVLQNMVQSVTSGAADTNSAIQTAGDTMDLNIKNL